MDNILENIKFNFRVNKEEFNKVMAEEEIEMYKRVVNRLFQFSSIGEAGNILEVEVSED